MRSGSTIHPGEEHLVNRSDCLVLFGATGDLARKKLFSSLYHLAAAGRLDLPVTGVALSDWDDQRFRAHARQAITETVTRPDPRVVDGLCDRLSLVGGDYADPVTLARLRAELVRQNGSRPTFYLAIPPSLFPTVTQGWPARAWTSIPASWWRSRSAATWRRRWS
jgi:glucose-6-phosphate 1-dehydrogenase